MIYNAFGELINNIEGFAMKGQVVKAEESERIDKPKKKLSLLNEIKLFKTDE